MFGFPGRESFLLRFENSLSIGFCFQRRLSFLFGLLGRESFFLRFENSLSIGFGFQRRLTFLFGLLGRESLLLRFENSLSIGFCFQRRLTFLFGLLCRESLLLRFEGGLSIGFRFQRRLTFLFGFFFGKPFLLFASALSISVSVQHAGCSGGHGAAVIFDEMFDRLESGQRQTGVGAVQQPIEFAQRPGAHIGQRTFQRRAQIGGQLGGFDNRFGIAGDDHVALLFVRPFARRLFGRLSDHLRVHVIIQFIQRDAAVCIHIGFARLQALHQIVGKHGVIGFPDDFVAFPGVLRGVGRGQHDAAIAGAFEGRAGAHRATRHGFSALRKRAAVAAVQNEHLPLGTAAIHLGGDEVGGDGGGAQAIGARVRRGQVQAALLVAHAVTGEIQHQQIVGLFVREEIFDAQADGGISFIDQCQHLIEAADGGVAQHQCQVAHILAGRNQFGQVGVLVVAVADDQCEFVGHGRLRLRLFSRDLRLAGDDDVRALFGNDDVPARRPNLIAPDDATINIDLVGLYGHTAAVRR